VDAQHAVSTAFHLINVPMGIWIDESGRIVRNPEPAWTYTRTDLFVGKPIATDGDAYLAALRDWIANGNASSHVLSDEEFARRLTPRSTAEAEADASFKLAVWLLQHGRVGLAAKHFARAQALHPDNWNYHRQEWSFTPADARKKWLEKFANTAGPYYPKFDARRDTSS
jgi:hypothetical protein